MTDRANALPTKDFFIDNITRDISLEDAILDLVDNAVDSLIRTYDIDASPGLLREGVHEPEEFPEPPLIDVAISEDWFEIRDVCGGIRYEDAQNVVFRFGRPEEHIESSLGVYGIGLKRAIFKLGDHIIIESRTPSSGFRVEFRVSEWAADEEEWTFPLDPIDPADSLSSSGTRILVTELDQEVKMRIQDGGFFKGLGDSIGKTHSLFLDRFLSVALNGERISAVSVPIGASDKLRPGHETFSWDSVDLELFAGLAARVDGEWKGEKAGWYVVCNGRVVVFADKTELTGWGNIGPAFQPKHRGFIGVAFFFSEDPAALPWKTTKRGLHVESRVYQLARKEMAAMGRPILKFLNDMYPSVDIEDVPERDLANELQAVTVGELASSARESFESPDTSEARQERTTVYVQYQAEIADVEKIKRHLDRPDWSAKRVGEYTFDYFIRMEIPE